MKKILLATSLIFTSLTLVGCVDDEPLKTIESFERTNECKPRTLSVQDGDVLYRNGIEILVFEDVKTGKYTISNEGFYELVRRY